MTKKKLTLWTLGAMVAPSVLYYGGQALNALVMAANGGQMPVLWPGGCTAADVGDGFHSCMSAATHLKFLSDWIVLHTGVASPGDMFVYLGDALWYPAYYLGLGYLAAQLWSQPCLLPQQSNSTSTQRGHNLRRRHRARGRHRQPSY